ncbi:MULTISPECIES: CAP domain-containing protein [Streptacidiphilus]|uniref:CAP domain-containing protein n=1 Tax=Streptacidiphilus cavernicola TaxID=3342716 RepID=A0ABV6UVJ2_9ACTN|nr:CAP domain-containing protein [Streptacidiphilus jeojiense]
MSPSRHSSSRHAASGQHRAKRRPRLRLAVTGAAALAVVGGGTAFACLGVPHASPAAGTTARALDHLGAKGQAVTATAGPTRNSSARSTVSAAARRGKPVPSRSATPKPKPSPDAHPTAPASSAPSSAPASASAPATTASATGTTSSDAVQQVLALINKSRAAQGLAPYTLDSGLNASAAAHNSVMASGCGLSHQCPGEAAFGDREIAAGVHWTSAGENIGEGGGVADTAAAEATSAVGLTQMMLDEQPPDDGHRKNILSSSFTRVGIAVLRDANGTVWLTQDFAN